MTKENIFETKSIEHLIALYSLPTTCSLVLESLTSMVDTAFAGHLGSLSSASLSAMGILNPILLLLIAAQLIFGVSTSIVISKAIGANDKEKVNSTFKVGFYSCFASSVIISLLIFLFQDNLLNLLGASGQVKILAKEFLNIAIIFNVFSAVGYMLVNNIRAFGYPKIEVLVGVLSTIINIAFNILLTLVFKRGIAGIALSTLISEIFYFSFALIFLIKKGLWFKKTQLDFDEFTNISLSLVKIGFVQFLMQALNSVSGLIVNKVLLKYGSISYIGAWSICSNINMVILLPLIGLTQGAQAVIAYFHGKGDKVKEKTVKNKIIEYSLIYAIGTTILIFVFADIVTRLFTSDMTLLELAKPMIRIIVVGFPLLGILYTLITFMQVSGDEVSASKIELIRQIALLIPLTIILPLIFSKYNIMNISPQFSVFFAIPLSTLILIIIYSKKIKSILLK